LALLDDAWSWLHGGNTRLAERLNASGKPQREAAFAILAFVAENGCGGAARPYGKVRQRRRPDPTSHPGCID
jgi:hypothetical protein